MKEKQRLSENALAFSLAIVAAIGMLLLGVGANLGVYTGAAEQMQKWHLFFSFSIAGIIAGMIEAAIWSYLAGWLIAYFYNKFI